MKFRNGLTILLVIAFSVEGKVKLGIILDESIVLKETLRSYLDKDGIAMVFVDPAYIHQSNIPVMLKGVNVIVCISTDSAINEDAGKLGEMLFIPVITSSPNTAPIRRFTVSMYPDYELVNRVMVDSLKYWKMDPVALMYDVKRSEQAANLQSLARKSNIRMFLMPEMNMDEEKSLSYAAGELKRSHLTAVVLLCDPKHISRVMDETIEYKLYENKETVWNWFALDLDIIPSYDCTSTLDGFVGFVTNIPDEMKNKRIQIFKNEILTTDQKIHTHLSNNFYANLHDMLVLAVMSCTEDDPKCLDSLREPKITACIGDSIRDCMLSGTVQFNANGTRIDNEIKIVEIKKETTRLKFGSLLALLYDVK